jgi:carbamoyl-phosphate synthase small subunit
VRRAVHHRAARVVAFDYGIKATILQNLVGIATVQVVPASMTADEVLALDPHGVFLSNGPGDPAILDAQVEAIRGLLGNVPVFGICLAPVAVACARR